MSKQKRRKVVLIERAGRLQSFNLPHEQYCKSRGVCTCTVRNVIQSERDPQTRGATRQRLVRVRAPKSITLLPGKESEPMDIAVLSCPDIDGAIPHMLSKREV